MNQVLSRPRLTQILESIRSLKIGVLGDFALDAYWYVDMARAQLSRETPLYNRPVVQERYSLGGSANVAWNLADVGVKDIRALSVLGKDWRAGILRDLMREAGIQSEGCLSSFRWSTVLFAKIFLSSAGLQQEDSRIDFINEAALESGIENDLLRHLENCLPELDALVISDYQVRSVITTKIMKTLNVFAEKFPGTLFVVDSRERIGQYRNMVLKPNLLETMNAFKIDWDPNQLTDVEVIKAGKSLQAQGGKPVFITLGERGCMIIETNSVQHLPAPDIPPPVDIVGAGDSFLASLAASLAAGASSMEAASIAMLAAGVTVKKIATTGTATPEEILALFDSTQGNNV